MSRLVSFPLESLLLDANMYQYKVKINIMKQLLR